MQLRRVFQPLLSVALLSLCLSAFAQRPEPRLRGPITESAARVMLSGSRNPRIRSAQDMGAVSPDTAIPGITLVFRRSSEQEATLKELLAAQQDTASPLYHHWLTPDTFAARFGVADEDIATVSSWLASRGFHLDNIARSHDRITFSGTAAQVNSAFGTELHHYRTEGESHFAPASDLTLPAELASVTAAVLHLSDFRPKPNIKVQTRPKPEFTSFSTQAHYLTPGDIETMYDLKPLTSNSLDGTGQAIAVVGQSYVDTSPSSSVTTFQQNLGTVNTVTPVIVPGSGAEAVVSGDEGESEIDLEYSSGIAFKANIFLVYVGSNPNYSVFDALAYAITEDVAPVVSISYGVCEPLISAADADQSNAVFEQAAAQGQTLVASAGDSGSTACAAFTTEEGVTAAQQQALAVSFPASSPYVTAVGGTQMAAGTFSAGDSSYWASASSSDNTNSLLSYVPEVVWNEDSADFGIAAGGGGTSIYFSRPSWQTGVPGIPTGGFRLLPDIALQSSVNSPGFLLCSSDPTLIGPQKASCVNGMLGSSNQYTTAGGTSFAAPIFAGFLAILNQQQQANGQGNINPVLYSLAANPKTYAAAFHDITSGTNACLPTAATCSIGGESNYAATQGYDQATGLGSLDFNALVTTWPASGNSTLQPTSVLLTGANSALMPGENELIQISVGTTYLPNRPYAPTPPTGNVSVSVDHVVVDPSLALTTNLTSVIGTYNLVAPSTTGSHLISVTYPGDATHSSSTATIAVTVGSVLASGGITLSAGNLTVANGASGTTQVTVTPTAGYSGTVVWSLSATSGSANLTACYVIAPLTVNNISTTQLKIGIGTACNSASPAVRGNFQTIGRSGLASNASPADWQSIPSKILYASILLCASFARRRSRVGVPLLLALAALTFAFTSLTGCGGGGGGASNSNPTTTPPPNAATTTYTLTLTATDSVNTTISASTNFTLTVN